MASPGKIRFVLAAGCLLAGGVPRVAAAAGTMRITIDGRFSPAQTLVPTNGVYSIGASLGKQMGSNLFQSFGLFGLSTGQTAQFSGPKTISNVIGGVSGGSPSSINGKIQSTIAGANLYLINPSGIVFGPNATVNVSGSFYASTASYLKLADGTKFQITANPNGKLSMASPAAFGFMNAKPAAITVNGSTLGVPAGQTLGLVAGPISITAASATGAALSAHGGTIHIASVAGTGEVPVDPHNPPALTVTNFGPVNITGGSTLDVSNPSGLGASGSVFIRSGALTIDASQITANNHGAGTGGPIAITATGQIALTNGGALRSSTQRSGAGGAIAITAGSVVLDGGAAMNSSTGIFSNTSSIASGAGAGGPITVVAGELSIYNAAAVFAQSSVAGAGGPIAVIADSVVLDGGAVAMNPSTGIFSATSSAASGAGNGGPITITAGELALHNGANVLAQSFGIGVGGAAAASVSGSLTVDTGASLGTLANAGGKAGDVSINAGQVTIDMTVGATTSVLDGIGSLTGFAFLNGETGNTGNAGDVSVTTSALTARNSGDVESYTEGPGNSGRVSVNVSGPLTIDSSNGTPGYPAGILGDSSGSGNAGPVAVTARTLSIVDGGVVSSDANASGNAGSVSVTAAGGLTIASGGVISSSIFLPSGSAGNVSVNVPGGLLMIDGTMTPPGGNTGIFAQANPGSTGDAGAIAINAGSLTIVNGAEISTSTYAGNAGSVSVSVADELKIDGVPIIPGEPAVFTGIHSDAEPGSTGSAGPVSVTAGSIFLLNDGEISSGAAPAAPPSAEFPDGLPASTGNAGQVTVAAGTLSVASNGQIASFTVASGLGGTVTVTIDGQLTIDGAGGDPLDLTGISTQTQGGGGNAGAITVTAGTLSIADNGVLTSGTSPIASAPNSGNGGNISVVVDGQLTIDGAGTNPNSLAGIVANSEAGVSGNAGDISVEAGALSVVNGGAIASALRPYENLPTSTGNAGRVTVDVASLLSISGSGSQVSTATTPGSIGSAGTVAVTAQQITLTNDAEITSATFGSGTGGSVLVDASRGILIDNSEISADAEAGSSSNAGELTITAPTLALTDGGQIVTNTFGAGNGGIVSVKISGALSIDGLSGISADAGEQSSGNAGDLTVDAATLSLSTGGIISSSTAGAGNGGTVSVRVPGLLMIDGSGLGSGISVAASPGSGGNAGNLTVNAGSLSITDGGEISANTFGPGRGGNVSVAVAGGVTLDAADIDANAELGSSGNGGNLTVSAGSLSITDGGDIAAVTHGPGRGGQVSVNVVGLLALDAGGIDADAEPGSSGNGGNLTVTAGALSITDTGFVSTSTFASGNAGDVSIAVTGPLSITGNGFVSTSTLASGAGGDVSIVVTGPLSITSGGSVASATTGSGSGGDVRVTATGEAMLSGTGAITASAGSTASGNAGSVTVTAPQITLESGAEIASTTAGTGNGGSVDVTTPGALLLDGMGNASTGIAASATGPQSGSGGDVTVDAGTLTIEGGAAIASSTASPGTGGDVAVTVGGDASLSGTASNGTASGITAAALAGSSGGAGEVMLTADGTITIADGAEVSSSTDGAGNGGSAAVSAQGPLTVTGTGSAIEALAGAAASGNGGAVTVSAPAITLTAGGTIDSTTAGTGNGGSVDVTTPGALLLDGMANASTGIAASATGPQSGSGGDVTVNAASLTVEGGAEIASSTAGPGVGGNVAVMVAGDILLPDPGPQISARSTGTGNAGSITLSAANLTMNDGAAISTEALTSTANGGNITLSLGDFLFLTGSEISTSVKGETGNGGNITIVDPQFVILNHSDIIAQAIAGHGGNITIDAGVFLASADSIVSATSQLGISGTVTINGPLVNLNGTLVVLSSELRNAVALTRDNCAARAGRPQSSLVAAGRGGLPYEPEATLPALYLAGRNLALAPHAAAPAAPPPAQHAALHLTMRCGAP